MRRSAAPLVTLAIVAAGLMALARAQTQTTAVVNGQVVPVHGPAPTTLDVYYVDTEGGKAVLFVAWHHSHSVFNNCAKVR